MAKSQQGGSHDTGDLQDKLVQSEEFLKNNKNLILYILIGVLVVGGGIFYYRYSSKEQDVEAQATMYTSVYDWENDSLKKAIPALEEVADEYGRSEAGNLAQFYLGAGYLKQGKYQEAIDALDKFSSNDLFVQARAYVLIGDAYSELKDIENAIKYYQKAVDCKPNAAFTPQYCIKAGLAYELNNDYAGAVKVYDIILKDYPTANEAFDAKKLKARAERLAEAGN